MAPSRAAIALCLLRAAAFSWDKSASVPVSSLRHTRSPRSTRSMSACCAAALRCDGIVWVTGGVRVAGVAGGKAGGAACMWARTCENSIHQAVTCLSEYQQAAVVHAVLEKSFLTSSTLALGLAGATAQQQNTPRQPPL